MVQARACLCLPLTQRARTRCPVVTRWSATTTEPLPLRLKTTVARLPLCPSASRPSDGGGFGAGVGVGVGVGDPPPGPVGAFVITAVGGEVATATRFCDGSSWVAVTWSSSVLPRSADVIVYVLPVWLGLSGWHCRPLELHSSHCRA